MDQRFLMSRRALLAGLGGVAGAALLPGGRARAAAPTRFVVVHVPEGMWASAKRPAAGTTTLGPILEALQPHQSRINVLLNLDMKSRDKGPGGDGHHRGVVHMLTGTEMKDDSNAGGASVDQKIAAKIGAGLPFSSLQFAVRIVYGDTNARPIWSGPGKVMPAMQSPFDAYKRLFSTTPSATPSTTAAPSKPAFDIRKSALDYALAESGELRNRLGTADRDTLDAYQESLRDIERRLGGLAADGGGGGAAGCAAPVLGASVDVKAESNYPKVGKLQMDMLVAALQCNLTRVASLQWGNSNDQCTYSFLGINTLGHTLSHNSNNVDNDGAKKLKVYRWYSEQFKYLLDKLASIPEGDGTTMLDNTQILWVSEFSDSMGHNANKLMWVMMGNAGGYFKTGRIVDCAGRSVNDLHTSLCNAYGIADKTFGNPAYCAGALPGIT